jgi:F0F1-type ATP synthase membrane subunit c/vacuolar-type H+-ATPase subunit K
VISAGTTVPAETHATSALLGASVRRPDRSVECSRPVLPDDDPGWPAGKELFLALLPGGVRLLSSRRLNRPANRLVLLRQVFLSFCLAIVMFGVVLTFLWPAQSKEPDSPGLAIGLIGLGLLAGITGRFLEKPLACADDSALAGSYRTRFFLRVAFAESAALFGFVGFFIASVPWVYPAGAAIAFVGFARAAPTRTNLRRDQERLSDEGCYRSLVRALAGLPPTSRGPFGSA